MKFIWIFTFLTLLINNGIGQIYDDYIGAGHDEGITVTSSSSLFYESWQKTAEDKHTVSGSGLEGKLIPASRFLAQATLGANLGLIHEVAEKGFETWLDEQLEITPSSYLEILKEVYEEVFDNYIEKGNDPNNFPCRPNWYRSNYAWWQMVMTAEDLLSQRIALALSEIWVISKENSGIRDYGFSIASYYDIFLRNSTGNFRDIMGEVTLHPAMGNYLSHLNNPKSNEAENFFPDENYAREIMQLFTIGLFELNEDGSRKIDDQGNFIPTYDNEDIRGLSKVLTGLGSGGTSECSDSFVPAFGLRISRIDMTAPMKMYEEWHEPGEKRIVGDYTIPAGQSGMEDINQALDHLFNHPNVGPFIGEQLIKRLVKSNPSPDYIKRVTQAFNQNKFGERGDMKAVIKAILLDPEARECSYMMDPENGKMREPILRYTHFATVIDKFSPYGRYWNNGVNFMNATSQHPMHSPTAFNFFQPDFQPNGPITEANLVAPEFQILNTQTSLKYINEVDNWTLDELLFYHYENMENWERYVYTDLYYLMNNARDVEVMLNDIDLLLTHGQMTERTRRLLKNVLSKSFTVGGVSMLEARVKLALYFILFSPDYIILK